MAPVAGGRLPWSCGRGATGSSRVRSRDNQEMPQLDGKARAELPDSAFAYVDSRGRRRLPINDEAHVRDALARFNQTSFEDEAARDRARTRLLRAAKKYGIVPIGFMTGQLRSQSRQAAAGQAVIELGGIGTPEQLEARLRTVLGDPTLSVLYWSESVGAYLDGTGQAAALPGETDTRTATLLDRFGQPMTALVHDRAVLKDPDLARSVTAASPSCSATSKTRRDSSDDWASGTSDSWEKCDASSARRSR